MSRSTAFWLGGIVVFCLFGGAVLWGSIWLESELPLREKRHIRIESGMSAEAVGEQLAREGIVGSVEGFRLALWILGRERGIQTGRFRLNPPLTRRGLVKTITGRNQELREVTIQEGWPSWQVYEQLAETYEYEVEDFQSLHDDETFLSSLNLTSSSLEGYLYPDTYRFAMADTPKDILAHIVEEHHDVTRALNFTERADDHGMEPVEALALASIIQREGTVTEEMPKISSVFHNRLDKGMKLQADPTVLYEFRDFSHPLGSSSMDVQSPYNTYQQTGLPPSPISNPGRAALRAAVEPADVDFLYFVARGDGSHVFSKTLEGHREAIQQYQGSE